MLQRLLSAGLISGLIVGIFVTLIQLSVVSPIILEAETYETAAPAAAHDHAPGTAAHSHDGEAWAPADGWERGLFTLMSNLVMTAGFALLLCAAYTVRGRSLSVQSGALWGLAGYLCFSFLPALGLPPELPGSAAAELSARQIWWFGTVAASAGGLALVVFWPQLLFRLIGIAAILAPHVIGAPHPSAGEAGSVPPELAAHFVMATMLMNAAMWIALGVATAYFYERFSGFARGRLVDIEA